VIDELKGSFKKTTGQAKPVDIDDEFDEDKDISDASRVLYSSFDREETLENNITVLVVP
jgi:hypothetical protein